MWMTPSCTLTSPCGSFPEAAFSRTGVQPVRSRPLKIGRNSASAPSGRESANRKQVLIPITRFLSEDLLREKHELRPTYQGRDCMTKEGPSEGSS